MLNIISQGNSDYPAERDVFNFSIVENIPVPGITAGGNANAGKI